MHIPALKHACQLICALAALFSYSLHAQTNLALNKTVTTNSENQSRNNAVDGDINTRWSSVHSDPKVWLQVDLGDIYELSSTVIHWETANASVYLVEGSVDGNCWTLLESYTGGALGNRTDTLTLSGSYRHLRINALEKSEGNEWGYSIWEWEVYGTGGPTGQVVFFEDFDNATLPTTMSITSSGSELVSDPAQTYGGQGRSLKYTYPPMGSGNGSEYPRGIIDLSSYNTDHVYIRFVAKMPNHKHGLKFIKIFSERPSSDNYSDVTFGLDYTGIADGMGSMYAISFGDGSTTTNDTDNTLKFNNNAANPGRSENVGCYDVNPVGYNFTAADWGTGWHKFELYVKFNSGTTADNEVNDGEFFVKIDDVVYMDAKCLYNRHYSNAPIDRIEILGWSQVPPGVSTPAFDIWYDSIEISLNGWGNNPL